MLCQLPHFKRSFLRCFSGGAALLMLVGLVITLALLGCNGLERVSTREIRKITVPQKSEKGSVLIIVRTSHARRQIAEELYNAWGQYADSILYVTDKVMENSIPASQQIPVDLPDHPGTYQYLTGNDADNNAKSCATTLLGFSQVLSRRKFHDLSWLVMVDDDTFVLKKNMMKYLHTINGSAPMYVAFAHADPNMETIDGQKLFFKLALSSSGFAFNKYLLELMRTDNLTTLFSPAAVYKKCRQANMMSDYALGRLATLRYAVPLQDRPFVHGDWPQIRREVYNKSIAINTQLRHGAKGRAALEILKGFVQR